MKKAPSRAKKQQQQKRRSARNINSLLIFLNITDEKTLSELTKEERGVFDLAFSTLTRLVNYHNELINKGDSETASILESSLDEAIEKVNYFLNEAFDRARQKQSPKKKKARKKPRRKTLKKVQKRK